MPQHDAPSTAAAMTDEAIRDRIVELCTARGSTKSICPSEVARALAGDEETWRALMKPVRRQAQRLAEEGRIDILKKGKPIAPDSIKGVIRLRIAEDSNSGSDG